jgi:hypothetical protein
MSSDLESKQKRLHSILNRCDRFVAEATVGDDEGAAETQGVELSENLTTLERMVDDVQYQEEVHG